MNKKFTRIFCLVLVAVLVLGVVAMGVVAMAATPSTLYFKPSTNWQEANARFSAYFFGNGEAWVSMTDSDSDGVYECAVPAGFTSVIFVRMNPDSTENNWNDGVKWNQTADLTIPTDGKNCFEVNAGEWNGAQGTWSVYESDNSCTHDWGNGTVTTEATCEKAGVKTYTCALCGNTKTESIVAMGHNFVNGSCSRCGTAEAVSRVIYFVNTDNWSTVNAYAWNNVSGNTYLGGWPGSAMNKVEGDLYSITVSGEATHIIFNNGSTQTTDLELSPEYNRYTYNGSWDYLNNCEHTYNAGVVTTQPTCTTEGVKTFTCTACGHTKTEVVAALGHLYIDGVCGLCGEAKPCDHTWDNGSTTTAVTCTTDGVKTYTCRLCGDTKTEVIAATGHKYLDGVCYNCGAKEPTVDYVDIANVSDLINFANRVNAGENTLNGRLVANIDLKGASWTPIGIYCPGGDPTKSVYYGGIFNGNGYTVSNFTVSGTDCVGLFGYADNRATIMNLGVINATMTGWNAGAICGYAPTATIQNCYAIGCKITGNTTNPVAINSEAVHVGAITGSNAGTVKNCYAKDCTLSISFVGQFNSMSPLGGVIPSNNYYCNVTGSFTNTKGATSVTAAQIASGEVAYKLGDAAWGQEIGKDSYPVIFGKTVYFENGAYTNKETVECSHSWTDATCTAPKTCSKCGATEGEALGHASVTYSFVNNTHTFTCTTCGQVAFTKAAASSAEKFGLKGASPVLSDDIVMVYETYIPAGFEKAYMVFEFNGTTTTVTESTYNASNGRTNFRFPGLNPQKMGDNIHATLYATVDGYEVSIVNDYSMVQYCDRQLKNASTSAALRTALSDLLVYGKMNQIYEGYKTDALCTDLLSANAVMTPSTFPGVDASWNVQGMSGTKLEDCTFTGVGVTLGAKIVIGVNVTCVDTERFSFKVNIGGVDHVITGDMLEPTGVANKYVLKFDKITAVQLGETITFSIWEGDTQVSRSATYSVYSYIYKNQNAADTNLANLLHAIYNYGEAVKKIG